MNKERRKESETHNLKRLNQVDERPEDETFAQAASSSSSRWNEKQKEAKKIC